MESLLDVGHVHDILHIPPAAQKTKAEIDKCYHCSQPLSALSLSMVSVTHRQHCSEYIKWKILEINNL
jgi:hypothetical protein